MTIQQLLKPDDFKRRLSESLQHLGLGYGNVHLRKHETVYTCGDRVDSVYIIESGQMKLVRFSPEGKECLLAILTEGETFGELCLATSGVRHETAVAMDDTRLKRVSYVNFFRHLYQNSLAEPFMLYLATRISEQQRVIANLITVDSEHRLGETLLFLAQKLGQPNPGSRRIEKKITHEELSEMVGTTRPRVTAFMLQFRALGLIEITPEHFLIIREKQLADYLARAG
ncbi:MAG: Crp/Fnr family transcriptional regulator [Pyrinomonadaceae bacterium]